MSSDDVLILTLGFDEPSFEHFDAMRRRHFPRKRNQIPAHLTLFHHLDGARRDEITQTLRDATEATPPIIGSVTGLRFLGYGCAYVIAAPTLVRLRATLATRWSDDLTPQDAQGFRPHVTIQNKAPTEQARMLFQQLEDAFEPFAVRAESLLLWRYLNGPWVLEQRFDLTGPETSGATTQARASSPERGLP